jgi:hypothetical protein
LPSDNPESSRRVSFSNLQPTSWICSVGWSFLFYFDVNTQHEVVITIDPDTPRGSNSKEAGLTLTSFTDLREPESSHTVRFFTFPFKRIDKG